ncbi:Potassium voltage-gated channel subfamily B member 2 [Durusdinium trenchii]|uniref:Potassium voltage-gated channel subfamily B member 2 n=1 Tax=Durusdinium trenchii TaxID=1381693 RepID=A0ABP0KM11_9DINO
MTMTMKGTMKVPSGSVLQLLHHLLFSSAQTCWKLELDALGELQLRLAGAMGSLSGHGGAFWLHRAGWRSGSLTSTCEARRRKTSDVAGQKTLAHQRDGQIEGVRSPLSPAEMDPLCFLLTCDVVCHDAAAAQLLPLVEQFEVTVDLERRRNEICCNASTARVNVNIDRVLVDFFRTVRQGLKQAPERPPERGHRAGLVQPAIFGGTVPRVQALTRSDLLQAGYLTMLDYDLSIPNGKIILGDNSVFGSDIAYFGIPLGDLGDICYARPSNDDEPAAMEDEVVPSSPIQCYGYVVFTIVLHECEFHVLDMGTALAKDITWKDTILKGSTQDVLIFKGRASVWNPAVLLDIGSVYSKPIPGPKGRKVALSKKRKHEESWRVQVLYGILPQQVPWDDAASLVAGYSSRKAWKRVMAFSGDVDKAAIKASMSNAVIFLIATLVPRLATTRELRAYLAGLGWLVALGLSALYVWYMDRTWDQVIGGFAGCVIAFTFGVMRNAGTARITYGELAVAFLTILFLGLRNSCLDLQSYEWHQRSMWTLRDSWRTCSSLELDLETELHERALTSSSSAKLAVNDTSEEEAAQVLKAAADDLGSSRFSASFGLMDKLGKIQGIVSIMASLTGYVPSQLARKAFSMAALMLRVYILVIPGQQISGVQINPCVRVTRGAAIGDGDDMVLLNEHCLAGQRHEFQLKKGFVFYLLTFTGARKVTLTEDVTPITLGKSNLKDAVFVISRKRDDTVS